MINAAQGAPHANRPGDGRAADFQHIFDFIQQAHRLAPFAVEFVDEGENGGVAQAADFHQLDGAFFDALGTVNDHQRRVHGCEGAVGIFGKVFVAGGIKQIDDATVIGELHHRAGDRDTALLFHFHPVRGGVTRCLAPFDRTGECYRAAEKQQFFGEGGFPRVGVGNDGKGAAVAIVVREDVAHDFRAG